MPGETAADATGTSRRRARALAVLVAALVVAVSLVPPAFLPGAVSGGGGPIGVDTLAHVLGAGAIAATTARALVFEGRWPIAAAVTGVALATGVGGAVELAQPTVGRTASLTDAAANCCGAVSGAALVVALLASRE